MVPSSQPSGAQHQWSCGAASCHHCPSRAMLCDRSASCCCAQLPGTPWPHCRGWGSWQSHSPLGVPFQGSAGGAGPQSILLCAAGSWVPTARCPLLQLSATPSLKVSAVAGSTAASSGRTTALPSCAPSLHPDYTGKGAGLACCRLCLQLLNQAVWKPYI